MSQASPELRLPIADHELACPQHSDVEPTGSESKEERVRFIDAMLGIREEIREIEEGKQPREGNRPQELASPPEESHHGRR